MAVLSLAPLTPYLAAAAMALLSYRRLRRYFGWQVWRPRRTVVRIALLSLVSVLLGWVACKLPHAAGAMAGGAALGAALGWLALRHTRIGRVGGVAGYTPHPWIGAGLALLLLGRLAWRWHEGAFAHRMASTTQQASPLTLGLAAMFVTYSLFQAVGLMRRMRALDAEPKA